MSDAATLLLFVLLLAALAAGWYLGFREGSRRRRRQEATHIRDYLQGMARDGQGRDAGSLTAIARTLPLNAENFEAHLSLGALFRRRGEVGRATELHARLRHLPGITPDQSDHADFELGRDFFAAGMLDRAELQFQGLVDRHSQFAQQALRRLARIYELERDWHSALVVAERLTAMEPSVSATAAHYCCELAEKSLVVGEGAAARRMLRRALDFDPACLRARLGLVEMDLVAGQVDAAIGALRDLLQAQPGLSTMVRDVLAGWLARLPLPDAGQVLSAEALLGAALPEHAPPRPAGRYGCDRCGYQAQSVLWCCPGCHGWGSLRPLPDSQVPGDRS